MLEKITYEEIEVLSDSITTVYFTKKSFNIESILRWLMDRKLIYDNFNEDNEYYVFFISNKLKWTQYEVRQLEGEDIGIEIGTN